MLTIFEIIGIILGFVLFISVNFLLAEYFIMKSDKKSSDLGFGRKIIWLNYKTFKKEYNKNPKKYYLYMTSVGIYDNNYMKFEIYFSDIISYYKYRIFYYNIEKNKRKKENQKNIKDFLRFIKE